MGNTATQLGALFSRTGAEMNVLLRDHGFLEGGPGAWRPTELGKQFVAQAHDHDNGYGGFAHRQWGWLSWKDELAEALRASMKANPEGFVASAPAPAAVTVLAPGPGAGGGGGLSRSQWATAVALGVVAASAPAAGRVWAERVKPAASKLRARMAERRSAAAPARGAEDDAQE